MTRGFDGGRGGGRGGFAGGRGGGRGFGGRGRGGGDRGGKQTLTLKTKFYRFLVRTTR